MSFPDYYQLPDNNQMAIHLFGNVVRPAPVTQLISELTRAA
ncbi:hypothetical protein [Aquipseudomonas alcaligenes]|nr:hypothetical protein [Pseudomonas alcaligenes]SUD17967.1 Uncharacterised protein [Pseudomonas alcaligenes]